MKNVEWGEYELQSLFDSYNGDVDIQKQDINGNGEYVVTAGLSNNGILGKTDIPSKVFDAKTITIDMFGFAFYRPFKYKMVTHARVFNLVSKFNITDAQGLFIVNSLNFLNQSYGYENMCSWAKIQHKKIQLPEKNGKIDFDFMESFIAELEAERIAELSAYLKVSGLDNYELSDEEQQAIDNYSSLMWEKFNVKELFGKSTRGKRLKSSDRITGNIPFVTAGETDEGISAFIGNDVEVFPKNTITIDMFGSAKYRNYDYGADDHIAVVHTENLSKYASIFVTTACHKAAHTGEFNYGHNFYAKDADKLMIFLPIKEDKPDFEFMETLISAIQKFVIKDVVIYTNKNIEATKTVVSEKL